MSEKFVNFADSGANRFVELLLASGLIARPVLSRSLRDFCTANPDESYRSLDNLAMFLVRRNEITAWQADNLREGRSKGFFVDRYILAEHLRNELVGPKQWYATYVAIDTKSNRRVLLRFLRTIGQSQPTARFEVIEEGVEEEDR